MGLETFQKTIGKTISGVIVAEHSKDYPRQQVFIAFNDGTYFELYGGQFTGRNNLDPGGLAEIRQSLEKWAGVRIALDTALQRNLQG